MTGQLTITPGFVWLPGQPITAAALDATASQMTATVPDHSIGKRELDPAAVNKLTQGVVGGFRVVVTTTVPYTVPAGSGVALGPYTATGVTVGMIAIPINLTADLNFGFGAMVIAANAVWVIAHNLTVGDRALPKGTKIPIWIL